MAPLKPPPWSDQGQREFNASVKKPAFDDGGVYWHGYCRPGSPLAKHFTTAGATEYGYAARSIAYTMRKLKKFGHTYPLVWSGEAKNLARQQDVRASAKGVRIVLRVNKLNFRGKGSKANMAEEVRTVSKSDAAAVTRVIDRSCQARLRRMK